MLNANPASIPNTRMSRSPVFPSKVERFPLSHLKTEVRLPKIPGA